MIDGLEYTPDILSIKEQEDTLIEIDNRPWLDDLKRRVQHYGYKYDYTSRKIDESMYVGELPDFSVEIAQKMLDLNILEQMPDQLIVNEYLPGQGISAHIDCIPCFSRQIVTVSLGWAYEMEFIHISTKEKFKLLLETGSVASLSGDARYNWTHQIRARKKDGKILRKRRVSLTFRNVKITKEGNV